MDYRRPVKGILKKMNSSNLGRGKKDSEKKSQSWDEMNIIATYKPIGKNYGHMLINESKTPYRYNSDDEAGSSSDPSFSMEELSERMGTLNTTNKGKLQAPGTRRIGYDEDEGELSQDEIEKRRQFKLRRKQIYDEGFHIKQARELIARDELEDHDDSDSDQDEGYKYRGLDQHQTLPEHSQDPSPKKGRQQFLDSQGLLPNNCIC